jgi:uncharacterized protein
MDQTPAFAPAGQPLDDDGDLTKLHPAYAHVIRLTTALNTLPFVIAAGVFEVVWKDEGLWPPGALIGVVLLIAIALIIRIPSRRYNARGYQISADRLRVVRGLMMRHDTVVPFSRVQHIDVNQGPLERFFGIATLTLHTAGNHNASVSLPGLAEPLARAMREDIRAHIRREAM